MREIIESRNLSTIEKFLFILVLFPSVTLSILSAEIFPWGLLFTTYVIINRNQIHNEFIFFVMILTLWSLFGAISVGSWDESVRSLFAYINAISVFYAVIMIDDHNKLTELVHKVVISLIIIGLLQFSGVISIIQPVIEFLIPRGSTSAISDIRGVSLLSSEPSRAAKDIIFMYLVSRFFIIRKEKVIIFDLIVIAFLTLIIKSTTGVIMFSFFMVISYCNNIKNLFTIIPVVIVFALYYSMSNISLDNVRAVIAISNIISRENLSDVFYEIVRQSGFRTVSVISAYINGFSTLIGGGIGNWSESSLDALKMIGVDKMNINYFIYTCGQSICPVRPTSFFSSLMLDVGIIGFLLVGVPLLVKIYKIKPEKPYCIYFLVCSLLSGSVGNPVMWVCIALLLKRDRNES